MRYIDADKLKSEFDFEHIDMNKTAACVHHKNILEIINQQPTADVVPMDYHERCLSVEIQKRMNMVEVVRCKDCIHNHIKSWNHGKRDNPRCRFTDIVRSNLFYCGFGERADR